LILPGEGDTQSAGSRSVVESISEVGGGGRSKACVATIEAIPSETLVNHRPGRCLADKSVCPGVGAIVVVEGMHSNALAAQNLEEGLAKTAVEDGIDYLKKISLHAKKMSNLQLLFLRSKKKPNGING
jgi:hypothetical protein